MTKVKWLDRRVAWPGPYLCLCLTEEATRKAFKHLGAQLDDEWCPPNGGKAHHLRQPGKPPACIVAVRDWEGSAPCSIAGILVHEAVHVWQQHRDDIGERHPASEQEAYAIQLISQTLMEDFARQVKERQA